MKILSLVGRFFAFAFLFLTMMWEAAGQSARQPLDTARIVSLGGDVTEILYALGAEDRIVGVDATSVHPPEALHDKPNVGYLRQLSTEGILSLGPTLVLANEKAGPPAVVAALASARAEVIMVPDEPSPEGIVRKVRLIAAAIGAEEAGAALATGIARDLDSVRRRTADLPTSRRGLFVLSAEGGRLVVGGRETAADAIFALAGVRNAAEGVRGYKPIAAEALLEFAPDVVFVMRRSQPGAPSSDAVAQLPAYRLTPAGRTGQLVSVDGQLLLGFGPRIAEAILTVLRAAYPEVMSDRAP